MVPISTHKFNEAINGVFRSKKSEFKKKQTENMSYKSTVASDLSENVRSADKGQKDLKQMMNKNQRLSSNIRDFDKENTYVDTF